ncbi:MAG: hypothetical protein AB7G25_01380 [Sphingomonadaceae bacterium]
MSAHVVIVDLFGLVLVALGFSMAFRQSFVRRMLGWSPAPGKTGAADPAAYGLRIAGVMVMVFGFALGMMVTLFNLA